MLEGMKKLWVANTTIQGRGIS